jgi:nitric oxide reductase NorD protein
VFINNMIREGGERASKRAKGVSSSTPKGEVEGDGLQASEPMSYTYDEWDFRAGDYRPNWCLLFEKDVEEGSEEYYEETLKKHAKLADQVRRQFEMLKPELFKKIKNLTDGEEYDIDRIIEAAVERKAKVTPSEKVYWRRNKEERSVAMAFLIDMSASTEEDMDKERARQEEEASWVDFNEDDPRSFYDMMSQREERRQERRKQRHRIIDVEKESAVLLIQALETVGDTYGVYGFSGYGRDNVEFFTIKDLDEEFGVTVKRRIEKIEPVRGTRMGPAIRHVIAKLDEYDARIKVLILLSDGRPQDHNYGRDRTEKDYAIHDTKMALIEAKRKNIIPFCLTVDQEGHDYLKAMCEDMGYEVVTDIQNLPGRLPTLYRMLTV